MEPPVSFAALLRRYRLAAGLPQMALAERAGLSVRAISDLERGERLRPYKETVALLADALRLSAADRRRLEESVRRARAGTTASLQRLPPIPRPATSLVGRERELEQVQQLLASIRLVTLTGAPGIGKTRLALECAARAEADYDAVAFVPLGALRDPTLVLPAIARTFGVPDIAAGLLLERLATVIGEQRLLLVLDNFEQVAAAAGMVGELLAACPQLVALVTSRARLHMAAEQVFAVPPLPLPDQQRTSTPEQLWRCAAIRLFVERARFVRRDFTLTDTNAGAVTSICLHLDGLPLAIELAAAHCLALPPQALLERLSDRLGLLATGPRDAPDRQQALRAAIAWSDELLAPPERALFHRLAIFAGGFALEAAEAICAGDDIATADVLGLLERLVDQSLVLAEPGEEARYRLLETTREYALEQASRQRERFAALCRAHRNYYLTLAEQAQPYVRLRPTWQDRLEREHDNLRAALRWSKDMPNEQAAGLRLATALNEFWRYRGYLREGRSWLEALFPPSADTASSALAVEAAFALGTLMWTAGDYAAAQRLFGRCLVDATAHDDDTAKAIASLGLGTVALVGGDFALARRQHVECLELLGANGDSTHRVEAVFQLGWLSIIVDDYDAAAPHLEEAWAMAQAAGDATGIAYALSLLGRVSAGRGEWSMALERMTEALKIAVRLGDRYGLPHILDGFAELASRQSQFARAVRLAGASAAAREVIDAPMEPATQALRERWLAPARTALDPGVMEATWAEGYAMSAEQAVAYALLDDGDRTTPGR
jgi:predicted ATPase/DNA-binding XRE family transcriptional regulator